MELGSSFSALLGEKGKKIPAKRGGSTEETDACCCRGGSCCVNAAGFPALPCVCRDWKENLCFNVSCISLFSSTTLFQGECR